MTITSFSELKTAISSWADVNDVDAYLDDVVSLATDTLNYGVGDMPPLRTREMMAVESLSPTDGACTLPVDYLQYRRVVEEASCRRNLQYVAMTSVEQMYAARESGLSNTFTIVDDQLYMFPLGTNDIELTYYQKIPHLTDAAPTNWLLTKHPGVYLHAGMYQLGVLRRDDDLTARSYSMVNGLVRGLSKSNFSSEFARAATRMRIAP
jgi:hypothetical protein